ncbi:hypothetical protein GCM10009836_03060 [Pseudonocardia ailaonensis]|uniref:Transposase IS111A/IS1328/IS1533 N-terminal domain-containing protein n=1 Tax=Pseudonocardia ailaonensis TaxID=367279 RepID=A0ABN2MK42_9PSEU
MITIGIDPRKSSLTAVALHPSGEVAATIRLEVRRDTVARLRTWAEQWQRRQKRIAALTETTAYPDRAR